jgi:hypothetical protein
MRKDVQKSGKKSLKEGVEVSNDYEADLICFWRDQGFQGIFFVESGSEAP